MNDTKYLKILFISILPLSFFLIIFLVLLVNESGSGSDAVIVATEFSLPFESGSYFRVTSGFDYRDDPFGSSVVSFHSGIDLGAICGTNIIASGDGVIYEVGYSEKGLGNYVYIEHNTDEGILYTAYGHMLDNSIIVEENQPILKGDVIGQVGSTGKSTGCHLHYAITKKIPATREDYIDPTYVITGLN